MNIVILAAGMGKRMRSRLPKVLQPIADKPMLEHVIEKARLLGSDHRLIVVIGHGAEAVKSYFEEDKTITFALQAEQLGTGHALLQALPYCDQNQPTLVLLGDVPLIRPQTLKNLIQAAGNDVGLLTVCLDDPKGYGRIVRENGKVCAIVEERMQRKHSARSGKSILALWFYRLVIWTLGSTSWVIRMLRVNTISRT